MLAGVFERIEQTNVTRPALQTEPRRNANHGAAGLCVLGKVNLLPERKLRVEVLQRDGSAGERLDQGALDGAQPIRATEITFDTATSRSNTFAAFVLPSS
jgi:hypothetical protein